MSKLNQVIYPLLPHGQYVDSDEAKEVKDNIKKLMLELIEETAQDLSSPGMTDGVTRGLVELRQKVEAL